MLNKLYDLVFGQKEYEKTKIEVRISLIQELIPDISIKKLDDFEKLEASIFKIKDQLRVKSSNLNKVANDSTRNLSRAQIDEVLTSLNSIKILFLQKAFTIIEKVESNQIYLPTEPENKKVISIPESASYPLTTANEENSLQNEDSKKETKPETFDLDKVLITESDNAEIYLGNGIKPYILVKFHSNINFSLLKLLSKILFENVKPDGTNIIIENRTGLIIPRFENDQLFELESNPDIDLKETQKKIFEVINKDKSEEYNEVKLPLEEEFKKNKVKDDSLDNLIEKSLKQDNTSNSNNKQKVPNKKDKITFIKDDEIEIEKQSPSESKDNEKIEIVKDNNDEIKDNNTLLLYSDDKIVVCLNKHGVLGEVSIKPQQEISLDKLNESELTYLVLFSKIFSSLVLEVTQCQGTNLLWNFSKTEIKIIPRFENDSVKFTWESKESSNEFLKQIQAKLLETLNEELKKVSKNDKNQSGNESSSEQKNQEKNSPKNLKKQKAKYLIESLKRIG